MRDVGSTTIPRGAGLAGGLLMVLLLVLPGACSTQEAAPAPPPPAPAAAGPIKQAPAPGGGSLRVKAVKDFLKFTVANAEGKVVGKGDTNITTVELPVGEYTVAVALPGSPPAAIKNVVVKKGATTEAQLTGWGQLKVEAVKDFLKFTVASAEGKVVGKGDTNITVLLLPAGEYSVTMTVGDFPAAVVKGVVVKDAATTATAVPGFATLHVKASKDFLKWKLLGKDGKDVAAGDTNITTAVVPAGEYTLAVAGKPAGPLSLKSAEKKSHQSGQ